MRFLVKMCIDYLKDKHNIILQQIESEEKTRKNIFDIMTTVHNTLGSKLSLKEKNIEVINNAIQTYLRNKQRMPINQQQRIVEPDLPRIISNIQEPNYAYEKIVNERKVEKVTPPTIDFGLSLSTADDPDAFTKKFKELEDQRSLLTPIPIINDIREDNQINKPIKSKVIYINSVERNWSTESRFNFNFKLKNEYGITKIILPDEDMVFPYLLQDNIPIIYDSFFLNKNGRGYNILKASYPINASKLNLLKANDELVSNAKDIYEIIKSEVIDKSIRFYTKYDCNEIIIGDRISLVHILPHNSLLCRLEGHEVIAQKDNYFDIYLKESINDSFTGIVLNLSMQLMIELI